MVQGQLIIKMNVTIKRVNSESSFKKNSCHLVAGMQLNLLNYWIFQFIYST